MLFPEINFNKLNETDVREEIISPLLRELGYRSGTDYDVIREQNLRYPQRQLGRKKPDKDPPIRGKADYICEVNNLIRWVIEAKSPDAQIETDHIEQAYSYANHPEVRAVYFCITNGREIHVFNTSHGPGAPAIMTIPYEELENSFYRVANILGPDAILKNFPNPKPDTGKPIGPGLRSIVRITNGYINYTSCSMDIPALKQLTITIDGGDVQRDEDGQLVVLLNTRTPIQYIQTLNEKLGLASFEVSCDDESISTNKAKPNIFTGETQITFPAGQKTFDINSWEEIEIPINMEMRTETIASGYLLDQCFLGTFEANIIYLNLDIPPITMSGDFKIHLA